MSSVSLNMIIGQKLEPFLEFALLSTRWVDEHIIVNTGDKDNPNLSVVKKIIPSAVILQFEGEFDFSAARNLALDNSTKQWILWQDADECHFDRFQGLVRNHINHSGADGIRFAFHHFLLDFFHYQSVDPRVILFKRQGKRWYGSVHEEVKPFYTIVHDLYTYHHYGYVKPQHLIYENWKKYWTLNPPEQYKVFETKDPDNIISDRVSVAHDYQGGYPEVIESFIREQKPIVKDYKFI